MASLRRWTCKVGEDYEGLDAKDGKLTAGDMQGRRRLRGPRRKGWQAYGGGHARSAKTTRASTQRTLPPRRQPHPRLPRTRGELRPVIAAVAISRGLSHRRSIMSTPASRAAR